MILRRFRTCQNLTFLLYYSVLFGYHKKQKTEFSESLKRKYPDFFESLKRVMLKNEQKLF